ncbi:glycosyltransferase family 2 protein [Candidatus Saccharibacteria bacterium]|nr:glycosyltransferase family 2 protein [Candidatus Saccharibacteria bacterium]MBP5656245.1 glycosyltransferase family 2 protein [Candidatus Saccharibacteria bacterium]
MKISFVIPVYNEEKGFMKFYEDLLLPELKKIKYDYELILVNDGSKDKSLEIIQDVAEKDKHVKVLCFSRNFGKEVALTAGIREASGDAVMTMDADGQQPPKLIHEFIQKWEDGGEIVIGVRGKFEKHGFIAKTGSKLFYKILNGMGVKDTVPGSTDFRLIDRCVADEYNKLTEHGRITRGLMDWMGFKKVYIDYIYGNRLAGKPSYNFKKLFQLAIDSFVSLSTTPLVIFGWIGSFITLASLILGIFVLIEEFAMGDPMQLKWTGTTCLSIFITFLIGLVLTSQAITALYISHIHAEAQGRPLYIIDRKNSRNLDAGKTKKA